jgi:hypothetical protein
VFEGRIVTAMIGQDMNRRINRMFLLLDSIDPIEDGLSTLRSNDTMYVMEGSLLNRRYSLGGLPFR